jgi:hypothetical protein
VYGLEVNSAFKGSPPLWKHDRLPKNPNIAMIHYYINPKSKQLIVLEFDDEAMEVTPLERIEVVGEVEESQLPLKPAPAYVPRQRKQRLCSVCEKPGYTARTCPKN